MFKLKEKKMKCEKLSMLISSYLDGELEERSAKVLGEHLSVCAECSEELEALKRLDTEIRGLGEIQAGDHFTALVMAEVNSQVKKGYAGAFGYVYSLVFAIFFFFGILINPFSQAQAPDPGKRADLASVLTDGQKFTSILDENSIIMGLTGGTNEKAMD